MFLHHITKQIEKELFMDLAVIVAMSSGKSPLNIDNRKITHLDFIDKEVYECLLEYEKSLNISYLKFLTDPKSKLHIILKNTINMIIEEYSNNREVKNELVSDILSGDIDIFSINSELIKSRMILLPKIISLIVYEMLSEILDIRLSAINNLTTKQKKTIFFELCRITLHTDRPSVQSIKVLNRISNVFRFDVSFFEKVKQLLDKDYSDFLIFLTLINE
ncbi:hypothetical protein [Lonepinella sp. BR2357]|uniref:hypothetical protein n=1 Tax=Lonepinella sp. BR2357 TaxID=3434549 RepID=UPI003F6DAEEA